MDSSSFWNVNITLLGLILTAIGIVIAIVIPFWIYLKQKNIKRLEYKVLANESLLSYHKDLENNLKIIYLGQEIKTLSLLNLEFINTGNVPIQRSDFDQNIRISSPLCSSVISAVADCISPNYQDPIISGPVEQTNYIEIHPLLINQNDHFTIKFLIDTNTKNINYDIDSRIIGIKKIEKFKERINYFLIITPLVLFSLIISVYYEFVDDKEWSLLIFFYKFIFFFLIGVFLLLIFQFPKIILKLLTAWLSKNGNIRTT